MIVSKTNDSLHNLYDLMKGLDRRLQKTDNPVFKKLKIELVSEGKHESAFDEALGRGQVDVLFCKPSMLEKLAKKI